jgi:hypothetical protein
MTVSGLIGGLFPTGLITLLLISLFRKIWVYNLVTVLIANALSAFVCILLGSFGYGDVGKALHYLIPQAAS